MVPATDQKLDIATLLATDRQSEIEMVFAMTPAKFP